VFQGRPGQGGPVRKRRRKGFQGRSLKREKTGSKRSINEGLEEGPPARERESQKGQEQGGGNEGERGGKRRR